MVASADTMLGKGPGEQVRIGGPAANCHLFDRDGIALDRVERHPMADIGREPAMAH